MNQQQNTMKPEEAASFLRFVIQKRTSMSGDELDTARNALNRLLGDLSTLDKAFGAVREAARANGIDVDMIVRAALQPQQPQQQQQQGAQASDTEPQLKPMVPTRADRRRKLSAVPAKEADAQE